jgi:hypothetical protein
VNVSYSDITNASALPDYLIRAEKVRRVLAKLVGRVVAGRLLELLIFTGAGSVRSALQ